MARVRARRDKRRTDRLSRVELLALMRDGEYPDREAAYWRHRDQVWAESVRRGDASRSESFWQYEAVDPDLWPRINVDPLPALSDNPPATYWRAVAAERRQAAERIRYLARHALLEASELEHLAAHARGDRGAHHLREIAAIVAEVTST